jgi:hypothetical protein
MQQTLKLFPSQFMVKIATKSATYHCETSFNKEEITIHSFGNKTFL